MTKTKKHQAFLTAQDDQHGVLGALDFTVGYFLDLYDRDRKLYAGNELRAETVRRRRSLAEAHEKWTAGRERVRLALRDWEEEMRGPCKHKWTGGAGFRECVWCSEPHPEDAP